jgi:hypothetical protein
MHGRSVGEKSEIGRRRGEWNKTIREPLLEGFGAQDLEQPFGGADAGSIPSPARRSNSST